MVPTMAPVAPDVVNQRLPSVPTMSALGAKAPSGAGTMVMTPSGVMRATDVPPSKPAQRLPSGPLTRLVGCGPAGSAKVVTVPASVIRATRPAPLGPSS